MGHVQEVDRFDIVALFRKIWPQFFKKLPLWICYVHRLPPLCAAYKEGNDETPGFPAAGRADAEQIVVVAGDHPVGGVGSVFVRIFRAGFQLSQHHALDFPHRTQLQKFRHLLFCQEAGRTVGSVREDVEAPGVMGILIAGKPYVALFRDETD